MLYAAIAILFTIAVTGFILVLIIHIKKERNETPVRVNNSAAQILDVYKEKEQGLNGRMDVWEKKDDCFYRVTFKLIDGTVLKCKADTRIGDRLMRGNTGILTYLGERVLDFVKDDSITIMKQARIIKKRIKSGPTVSFYCSFPTLGIEIPANRKKLLDLEEILSYADNIFLNNAECFFGMINQAGIILQFFYDGKSDIVELDMPQPERRGSFAGELKSTLEIKKCIEHYFEGKDIKTLYNLEYYQW